MYAFSIELLSLTVIAPVKLITVTWNGRACYPGIWKIKRILV